MNQIFDYCKCHTRQLRKKRKADGVVIIGQECLLCGNFKQISKVGINIDLLPWSDSSLIEAYRKRVDGFYKSLKENEARAFWEKYNAHLASPKWQQLRRKVFLRSKGVCEGCGERSAVQVHHLTYERLGNEMLFDLAAVCITCHELIHELRNVK